jgi:hypothetical protein
MDLALILAIVALVLATPLNVAANLLTPICRDWYIGRSQSKIKKRLSEIALEITSIETLTPQDLQDAVVSSIELLLMVGVQLYLLGLVVVLFVMPRPTTSPEMIAFLFEKRDDLQFVPYLFLAVATLFLVTTLSALKKVFSNLRVHRKSYLRNLLKEKENLEGRLTSRNQLEGS